MKNTFMVQFFILFGLVETSIQLTKLKKSIFLVSFLMSFGSLFSQNSLFIEPIIGTKFSTSSTYPFFSHSNKFPSNPYFDVYNKQLFYPNSIRFGLSVGWKNTKNKFTVGLGWIQDGVSVSNETVLLTTNGLDNNYHFNQNLPFLGGFTSHRFTLHFTKPLFSDILNLKIGLGMHYLPGGSSNYSRVTEIAPFLYDSLSTLYVRYSTAAVNPHNLTLTFGLVFNIKWNDLYLFSIEGSYLQGIKKNLLAHENYYELTNLATNEKLKYSYVSASKGSGLNVQISRTFDLYKFTQKK
jgi:hypothetical protein